MTFGDFSLWGLAFPIIGFTIPRFRSGWNWDIQGKADPQIFPTPAPIGTSFRDVGTGLLYMKVGEANTDWQLLNVSPQRVATYLEDFVNADAVDVQATGAATAQTVAPSGSSFPDSNLFGAISLQATPPDSVTIDCNDGVPFTTLGNGQFRIEWRVGVPSGAPVSGDDVNISIGDPSLCFVCGFLAQGNSNWWASTSPTVFVDTGIPVDDFMHRFTIVYNALGATPTATWYIDDNMAATLTTDLPVGQDIGLSLALAPIDNFREVVADYVTCSYALARD